MRQAATLLLVAACAAPPDDDRFAAEPPRPAPPIVEAEPEPEPAPVGVAETDDVVASALIAGEIAGKPLLLDEILLEWHRTDARQVFLIVEKLVSTRLAYAEADRLGLRLDPTTVEASYDVQIARLATDVAREGGGLTVEEFLVAELGVEPERYYARVREGTIRQMIAERAVRSWALENESAEARLIVVSDEERAGELKAEAEAGADFATLAREHSLDESRVSGGLIPFLVRQEHSPLARLVFATEVGAVGGPLPAAGHWFLVRVEAKRAPLSGRWRGVEQAVESSLVDHPVTESEFLHWKLEMERRYPVDLAPFMELVGAPGSKRAGKPRDP